MNKQIKLKSRPKGKPTVENFEIVSIPDAKAKEGELIVKAKYISVDPYMRGRMNEGKSYIAPFEIGKPIEGGVVAEVIVSNHPNFIKGDAILASMKWQKTQTISAQKVTKLDKNITPLSYYLGILGMPGLTAYFGLLDIGKPKTGETIVISGAAGAVGMVVGQIGEIKGCRIVGITGSDEKCTYLSNKLQFDEVINYKKTSNIEAAIRKACPDGVDIYFDNVGGEISDAVISQINQKARIIICGQISSYNNIDLQFGLRPQSILLKKSALMQGYIVGIYSSRFPEGVEQLTQWLNEGKLRYKETIVKGFETLPETFIGLFEGKNIGKMLVEIE